MLKPHQNTTLYGHDAVEAQLFRLIQQNRLPHAILLCGAEGIGKATLAFRLARYLLAGGHQAEPVMGLFGAEPVAENLYTAPDHPASQRIAAGTHANLFHLHPVAVKEKKMSAEVIYIDQVREVREFLQHSAAEDGWRIVIIEPAEAMNNQAANGLLKLLEEPPQRSLFLLVSHHPGKLLTTIKSRCRRLNLQPPNEADCLKIFAEQDEAIENDKLHQLLMLAGGSAGRALQFYQQDALEIYRQLLNTLAHPDNRSVITLAGTAAKSGTEQWRLYQSLLPQLVYRLSLYAVNAPSFFPLDAEEAQAFDAMLTQKPASHWLDYWEKAEEKLPQTLSLTMDKTQTMLSLLK